MKEFLMKDPFCTVIELLILSEKQSTVPSEMVFNSLFAFFAPRRHSQELLARYSRADNKQNIFDSEIHQ